VFIDRVLDADPQPPRWAESRDGAHHHRRRRPSIETGKYGNLAANMQPRTIW